MGVDGGADALIEAGYKPDMIIGDMDSCSDAALQCGAELVVHAYRDGHAPGIERLEKLGLTAVRFPALGTSEDAAMLLADSKGAELLVAVGTHASLVEFWTRAGQDGLDLPHQAPGRPEAGDAKGCPGSIAARSELAPGAAGLVGNGRVGHRPALHRPRQRGRQPAAGPDPRPDLLAEGTVYLINFRYHIVSLMAVFLALAVGIAVGVTLRPSVDEGLAAQAAQDRKQVQDLRAELSRRAALDEYREVWASRVGEVVTTGMLAGTGWPGGHAGRADGRRTVDQHRRDDGRGTVSRTVKISKDAFDRTRRRS
jgi:hypothetical protein